MKARLQLEHSVNETYNGIINNTGNEWISLYTNVGVNNFEFLGGLVYLKKHIQHTPFNAATDIQGLWEIQIFPYFPKLYVAASAAYSGQF